MFSQDAVASRWTIIAVAMLASILACSTPPPALAQPASAVEDAAVAQSLAEMLQAARTIVSDNQTRINDPQLGDKGLTGQVVLDQAVRLYKAHMHVDPTTIDANSRHGRLMRAMMVSITEVVDANQNTMNARGVGFKGFIPAVFGRLISESFARHAAGDAEIKITAPPELVRNRKARPDNWEESIIKTKLIDPEWPRGKPYSAVAEAKGRPAYRVMVPEYYVQSCLSCHGSPKGEMDITGYPKEGRDADDLGGVISITLYR